MTLDEIRAFFYNDRFATEQGITIDSAGAGEAVCSVLLRDGHKNADGAIQGGLIFTLADFAFAVAVNSEGLGTVTLNSSINFLRRVSGERLIATTNCRQRGRSTCVYQVDVTDDRGGLVAVMSATGFTRRK